MSSKNGKVKISDPDITCGCWIMILSAAVMVFLTALTAVLALLQGIRY